MNTSTVDLTESRQAEVLAIAWVFTGIAIAIVILKLFARARIAKVVGWDDFFIFFSLALSIIASAFVTYSVTLGFGRHTLAVLAEEGGGARLVETAKWQMLGYPFNIGAFSFPNVSIVILVINLLEPNTRRSRALYIMVIMQVVIAMISVFIVFLQCTPTEKLWNKTLPGTCWSPDVLNNYSYFTSAYTTVTDIVLAVVPITSFWKLQMRLSTKLGLCIMMGLTLLSAVVTIVKACYLNLFTDPSDPLFKVVTLVNWGLVEQNIVIVAACIPTLRPFFHKAFKGDKSSKGLSGSGSKFSGDSFFGSHSQRSQKLGSVSEMPLDDVRAPGYADSHNSQQGIWRTVDFSLDYDVESADRMSRGKPSTDSGIRSAQLAGRGK